jgi:hypothetical protein
MRSRFMVFGAQAANTMANAAESIGCVAVFMENSDRAVSVDSSKSLGFRRRSARLASR